MAACGPWGQTLGVACPYMALVKQGLLVLKGCKKWGDRDHMWPPSLNIYYLSLYVMSIIWDDLES